MSVGLFQYLSYLVKAVENWWCPFFHGRKEEYRDASLDRSYWHATPGAEAMLTVDDRDCAIWNDDFDLIQITPRAR